MTTEQKQAASTSAKPFVVKVNGEEDRPYVHMKSARERAEKVFEEDGTKMVEVFDANTGVRKLALIPNGARKMEMDNEVIGAPEEGKATEERQVDDQGCRVNEHGVRITTVEGAELARKGGRITSDLEQMVVRGECTLEQAKAETKALPPDQRPKKTATANKSKATTERRKSEKKAKPKPEKLGSAVKPEKGELPPEVYVVRSGALRLYVNSTKHKQRWADNASPEVAEILARKVSNVYLFSAEEHATVLASAQEQVKASKKAETKKDESYHRFMLDTVDRLKGSKAAFPRKPQARAEAKAKA